MRSGVPRGTADALAAQSHAAGAWPAHAGRRVMTEEGRPGVARACPRTCMSRFRSCPWLYAPDWGWSGQDVHGRRLNADGARTTRRLVSHGARGEPSGDEGAEGRLAAQTRSSSVRAWGGRRQPLRRRTPEPEPATAQRTRRRPRVAGPLPQSRAGCPARAGGVRLRAPPPQQGVGPPTRLPSRRRAEGPRGSSRTRNGARRGTTRPRSGRCESRRGGGVRCSGPVRGSSLN